MSVKKLLLKSIGMGINVASLLSFKWGGELAFKVFSTPPKPRIRAKEAKFLDTATRLDYEFEGKRIAVYGWSKDPNADWKTSLVHQQTDAVTRRPYVLLAYGWGYNAGRWRYFVPPLLDAGLDVIAYDPFGHGNSSKGVMEYPLMVRMQTSIIQRFGRATYFLGHSFGGGGLIGAMEALPKDLRPQRVCLMGVFSDARWIFHNYRSALGLSQRTYLAMVRKVFKRTGRRLSSFDNALIANQLDEIEALIIHDPKDKITSFSNAVRNHHYWKNSWLYEAKGAGHHLGTAEVTQIVMSWLLEGELPTTAHQSNGLPQAKHDLHTYFIPVEQDCLHGKMRSGFYA